MTKFLTITQDRLGDKHNSTLAINDDGTLQVIGEIQHNRSIEFDKETAQALIEYLQTKL